MFLRLNTLSKVLLVSPCNSGTGIGHYNGLGNLLVAFTTPASKMLTPMSQDMSQETPFEGTTRQDNERCRIPYK